MYQNILCLPMEKPEIFRIKAYGWQELAVIYSPEITAAAAARRLIRWVEYHPHLKQELIRHGWKKANRVLSPMQVQIIVNYLGEP